MLGGMASIADPSPWESAIVLGNGDTAVIRPLVPADRDALAAFHRAQSADSIYKRFFSPKPELSTRDLEHFTEIDRVDRVALVVESRGEFVAWSSYERWPGRNEAEAAFMVADDHQHQGIATLMLEHLAAIARSNGIERFTAEVLADNRPMLAVFAKAGWPLQRRFESGVVDLDWELATTDEFLDSVERREQRGDSRAVARILLPRAIAVIGASHRQGSVGAELWHHVASSVTVPKYAVNPNHSSQDAYEWYATVDDLPDEVSLAIIAVPADQLDETIDACIRKRMRGAVVVTVVDGSDVDVEAMVVRARRNGLRLIGPSSMGVASPRPESLLQAALVDVTLPAGNVAISMQSGSLGSSVLRQARDLDLGLSWFVSLGDKADISANDLLQFWEEDTNTTVVGMYTESFGNPRKFARIARRVSMTMPIVAVRTGAASVGTLGSALYQQAGLIEVPTVNALLHTLRVMATQPRPHGPNIAVLTNSRSPGTLARAALESVGLVAVDGPIALDWRSRPDDFRVAIRAALDDDAVHGVLVIHAPAVADDVDSTAEDIHEVALGSTKPVVAVMLGSVDGPIRAGSDVPAFAFPEQAAAVLGRAYAYGQWLVTQAEAGPDPTRAVDPEATRLAIDEIISAGRVSADLREQRRMLEAYGISFARARDATPSTAVSAADEIGYPVAIKATRRRPGRSVRSGVALDVTSAADVDEVVAMMVEAIGSDADHLIVQTMTTPGVDLRIHCEHDERLGVIVSVGLGGAQADVIADRTSRLAPVSPSVVSTMLDETRIRAALADIDPSPVVDAIVQAAQLASDHGRILELDLNPVIVSEDGAVVTDAVIRLSPVHDTDQPLRKLL
jgi:acyl-CoA synthetase (NDP forming)/RimJ/RimL family protein N-acetyltransferase